MTDVLCVCVRNEQDAVTWEKEEKKFISFLMKAGGMILEHKHDIQVGG